jgi:transposase
VLTLPRSVRIDLAIESVDLRRGHDGLAAIVQGNGALDLVAGHLFAFVGRRGDRCKILFWDGSGLVLYDKRLERGCFRLPQVGSKDKTVEIEVAQLAMLLDGMDYAGVKRPRHWQPQLRQSAAKGIDRSREI